MTKKAKQKAPRRVMVMLELETQATTVADLRRAFRHHGARFLTQYTCRDACRDTIRVLQVQANVIRPKR